MTGKFFDFFGEVLNLRTMKVAFGAFHCFNRISPQYDTQFVEVLTDNGSGFDETTKQ